MREHYISDKVDSMFHAKPKYNSSTLHDDQLSTIMNFIQNEIHKANNELINKLNRKLLLCLKENLSKPT
jgi:hypothetical protein